MSPKFVAKALCFLVDGIVTDWNKDKRKIVSFIPRPTNSPVLSLDRKDAIISTVSQNLFIQAVCHFSVITPLKQASPVPSPIGFAVS